MPSLPFNFRIMHGGVAKVSEQNPLAATFQVLSGTRFITTYESASAVLYFGIVLTNFKVTTTSGSIFVDWGDQVSQIIPSNTDTNHTFICQNASNLGGFWNNIEPCP